MWAFVCMPIILKAIANRHPIRYAAWYWWGETRTAIAESAFWIHIGFAWNWLTCVHPTHHPNPLLSVNIWVCKTDGEPNRENDYQFWNISSPQASQPQVPVIAALKLKVLMSNSIPFSQLSLDLSMHLLNIDFFELRNADTTSPSDPKWK